MVDWGAFQTMDDFLFLRKYRSRETARPCGGSIYANQIRDGKRMTRKQNSKQIGAQHTRARGGHVHRQNISLIIKKTYGWLGSVVQTMEDFLFLIKYRSRESARPCSGSIYANQLRDGKRMTRKQNSNQIGVQHTARILSRYQCAREGHVHRQNISLIIKKAYGWLGSVVQTMEDFSSSENTVLVRLRARAVAASTQTSYGMVRGWHASKIATRYSKIPEPDIQSMKSVVAVVAAVVVVVVRVVVLLEVLVVIVIRGEE